MIHRLRLLLAGRVPGFFKEGYLRMRQLNAGARALPDFLIIGAQKAGTTSLHNYLCLHPRVIGSLPKEIFYFDSHPERGERWYRRHFPTRHSLKRSDAICGEATPTYLYSPQAAERAAARIPQARILVLLREPAARAVSQFYHRARAGRERRVVDEVFSADAIDRMRRGAPEGETETILYQRSLYAPALRHWFSRFPRGQVLVIEAERFFSHPKAVFDEVCSLLGVDPFPLPSASAYNRAGEHTPKPERFAELREVLAAANADLPAMGVSMSWLPT